MLIYGVDIGGSKISMGRVQHGVVIRKLTISNTFIGDPDGMVQAIVHLLPQLYEDPLPRRIGLGCPGWVVDGVVYEAVNLGISAYPLQAALKAASGMDVYLENDARCALLAELSFGALRDCTNGAMVTFGTGVGGALAFGKKLYKGSFGYAGEIGHMTVESCGDCLCGKRGCYEMTAAVPALLQFAKAQGLVAVNGQEVFEAAEAGDLRAADALAAYLPLAARGIIELSMLLDLDTICIGGGISIQQALFVNPLSQLVKKFNPRCKIVPAVHLNDAGILGAAELTV